MSDTQKQICSANRLKVVYSGVIDARSLRTEVSVSASRVTLLFAHVVGIGHSLIQFIGIAEFKKAGEPLSLSYGTEKSF